MNAPASGLDIEVDDIFGIDVPGREIIGKDLVCIAGRKSAGDHSFEGSLLIKGEHAPDFAGAGSDLSPAESSGVAVLVFVNFFSVPTRRNDDSAVFVLSATYDAGIIGL